MKAILGSIVLATCVTIAIVTTIQNSSVELAKSAMENYEELNFLSEPYMASLSKITYGTSCGETEIYELMAYAAAEGSSTFEFCGGSINLNEIIDPLHYKFQSAFGAGNYYIFIEDASGNAFFSSPMLAGQVQLENVVILTQMPLPLPGEKVSRAILAKAEVTYGNATVSLPGSSLTGGT
jgi:hypothetical protein